MEKININQFLNREQISQDIKNILKEFELNKNNLLFKRGLYIYGEPGIGKSIFVTNVLKELDYDIIKYDAGDVRSASVIEDITKHNMSDKNIMSLFNKKIKKIAIIMDEIDGMNNGDKGGINSLIKLIRPKKTKKQKLEKITMIPIICIGNYKIDKKIKELMKVCNIIELNKPNNEQLLQIINILFINIDGNIKNKISLYTQGDLRKLNNLYNIFTNNPSCFNSKIIDDIFQIKYYNDDTKKIANRLINNYYSLNEHNNIMNETDRTSVALLWHENIIDTFDKLDKKTTIPFYISQLENICFADYIDRITFQKQIWQFNEMSSLIKTFKNNKLFHETLKNKKLINEIRFTKVLTKYSTEYNNSLFIQKLCQKLGTDIKDLFVFFINLKNKYEHNQIISLLEEKYDIKKLDINRIYRYIEKYTKENAVGTTDKEIEEIEEIEEFDYENNDEFDIDD